MTDAPVSVQGLDAVIDANRILTQVSLPVYKGQFTGIIGRNGSGKSTLVRCMSRTLAPAAGSVTVDGLDIGVYARRDLARKLSVVPQEAGRAFSYTVLDVVTMGRYAWQGLLSGHSVADKRAFKADMATPGIAHLAERRIPTLSGGEWQRVLIARTLAQETGIILLDEPTSHLDISHQIEILSALAALTRSGTTVIAAFHDLNLAAHYCDRIIALHDGKVVAAGPPADVITHQFLREVFSLNAEVRIHPATGKPLIFPQYALNTGSGNGRRVHVICGGGTGTDLLYALKSSGCQVTTGVLAMNDADYTTAVRLGIPYIAEPPFAPVSKRSEKALQDQIRGSEIIVITPAPVGDGNLANLSAVEEAGQAQIFFLGEGKIAAIEDFCNGQGKATLGRLAHSGQLKVLPGVAILRECVGFPVIKPTGDFS